MSEKKQKTTRGRRKRSADGSPDTAPRDAILLEDVLKTNEEEHLFYDITALAVHVEQDPPLVFAWENVGAFVLAIQAANEKATERGAKPLPFPPFAVPTTLSVRDFKRALLDHARIPGAAARLGTSCLPCSLAESIKVGGKLQLLDMHPWTQAIVRSSRIPTVPIARIYIPRPRSSGLESVTLGELQSLWG